MRAVRPWQRQGHLPLDLAHPARPSSLGQVQGWDSHSRALLGVKQHFCKQTQAGMIGRTTAQGGREVFGGPKLHQLSAPCGFSCVHIQSWCMDDIPWLSMTFKVPSNPNPSVRGGTGNCSWGQRPRKLWAGGMLPSQSHGFGHICDYEGLDEPFCVADLRGRRDSEFQIPHSTFHHSLHPVLV